MTTDTTTETDATTPEQPETPPEGTDLDDTTSDGEQDEENGSKANNAEAAKYRVRLRETEAERDALTARVQGYLRADAERVLAAQLSQPADLFDIGGADLADLLDEDGEVDPAKVEAAAEALIAERPGLAVPKRRRGPSGSGMGRNNRASAGSSSTTWGDVLRR